MTPKNEAEERSDGSLLAKLNIAIQPPKTLVCAGSVWRLGKHTLACESVILGWPRWIALLKPGMLLCPFPGPYVAISIEASSKRMLLVQPDTYTAAHIIDRYIDIFGSRRVRRCE